MYTTNVTILRANEGITSTTRIDPSLSFLRLPFLAREVNERDRIAIAILHHTFWISSIIFTCTPSASFGSNHIGNFTCMSELRAFVYILGHVTLHVKSIAQKVNWRRLQLYRQPNTRQSRWKPSFGLCRNNATLNLDK